MDEDGNETSLNWYSDQTNCYWPMDVAGMGSLPQRSESWQKVVSTHTQRHMDKLWFLRLYDNGKSDSLISSSSIL